MPVTFVGHPLAQEAATLATKREAREQLKLRIAAAGVRAAARQPHVRSSRCTAISCCRRRRGSTRRAPRCAVPRPVRDAATRDAFEAAMLSPRPCEAADHAPLRPRRRRAARGRRRRRRVRNGHARGGARALSARHLLSRERDDCMDRRAAAPATLGRIAQRAGRTFRRARTPARSRRRSRTSRRRRSISTTTP